MVARWIKVCHASGNLVWWHVNFRLRVLWLMAWNKMVECFIIDSIGILNLLHRYWYLTKCYNLKSNSTKWFSNCKFADGFKYSGWMTNYKSSQCRKSSSQYKKSNPIVEIRRFNTVSSRQLDCIFLLVQAQYSKCNEWPIDYSIAQRRQQKYHSFALLFAVTSLPSRTSHAANKWRRMSCHRKSSS